MLVLKEALHVVGLASVSVTDADGQLVFNGGKTSIAITNLNTSQGADLTSFDIANATTQEISSLTASVSTATEQVIQRLRISVPSPSASTSRTPSWTR
jgi:hypothetical protein